MATAPALMTMEQYLHTSYSPDVDFVDGDIQERNLGEFEHGHIQGLIFAWFLVRANAFGIIGSVEQRIRVSAERVRICDVAILRKSVPRERVTTTPPFICIEVLSPEDRLARAERVLADYQAMGVKSIWLVDPIRRVAYFYDADGLHMASRNTLRVADTEIELGMDDLFDELDQS
jgi:Uma2 family endonuclease